MPNEHALGLLTDVASKGCQAGCIAGDTLFSVTIGQFVGAAARSTGIGKYLPALPGYSPMTWDPHAPLQAEGEGACRLLGVAPGIAHSAAQAVTGSKWNNLWANERHFRWRGNWTQWRAVVGRFAGPVGTGVTAISELLSMPERFNNCRAACDNTVRQCRLGCSVASD